MAQYLKSLVTGVVLPYVEQSLKSADVRLMEPAECAEYEASIGLTSDPSPDVVEPTVTAEPVVEPEPVVEEPVVETVVEEVTTSEMEVTDISEGPSDVEGVLSALEDD